MANISAIKVGNTSYGITPASHASTATTYGAATASKYGHVKLSDNYTSSAGAAASGIGASSLAVYNAYNKLNNKFKAADYTIILPQLSWIKAEAGKYYAYYSLSSLNATTVLSVTMIDWSSLRDTDNIMVGGDNSNILISSNVNTFVVSDANVSVRVYYA